MKGTRSTADKLPMDSLSWMSSSDDQVDDDLARVISEAVETPAESVSWSISNETTQQVWEGLGEHPPARLEAN